MSWDGMLDPPPCRVCGAELGGRHHADGGWDRPAERYAGTYTGLCYRCERRGAMLIVELSDGAQFWSYPPHCPSWRRDRYFSFGYADCPNHGPCHFGRTWHSRADSQGGSYPGVCHSCSDRYHGHPMRKALHEWLLITSRSMRFISDRASRDYSDRLTAEAKRRGLLRDRNGKPILGSKRDTILVELGQSEFGLQLQGAMRAHWRPIMEEAKVRAERISGFMIERIKDRNPNLVPNNAHWEAAR